MRHPDLLRLTGAMCAGGMLLLAGCEGGGLGGGLGAHRHRAQVYTEETGGPIESAQPVATVVGRVNSNSSQMNFLLRGGGAVARGEYMERRKPESYELKGTLLYSKPRSLYLQLQHALGGKMEIGSNSNEFWVWKRMGKDHYWWGQQRSVDAHQDLDIPLLPTDIVEVLGLGELPANLSRSDLKVSDSRYEIRLPGRDARGRSFTAKIIRIDRRAPYLVREMEYLTPGGGQRVVAHLSRYGRVQGSEVLVPFRVQIEWPERGGNMDLTFSTMQRFESSEAVTARFLSPTQRGKDVGVVERVDTPMRAEAP